MEITKRKVEEILALFEKAFGGRTCSEAYYRWRVLEHPSDKQLVELHYEDGALAAHYALCPSLSYYQGSDFLTALSLITMTDPAHAGKGLFPKLASRLYKRVEETFDVAMVYGFPNKNSHYGFVTKLGWHDVYILPMMKFEVKDKQVGSNFFTEVSEVSSEFDSLWLKVSRSSSVLFPNRRDSVFLKWRFLDHPENDYSIYKIGDNEDLSGYVVLKSYINSKNQPELDIVDYLISQEVDEREFLVNVSALATSMGYSSLNCWFPYSSGIYQAAEKLRWGPGEPLTYLGYRPGSLQLKDKINSLSCASTWHITMADSDVY
jgi:hypothetical protein